MLSLAHLSPLRLLRPLRLCLSATLAAAVLLASGCGSPASAPPAISVESSGVTIREAEDLSGSWPGWRGPAHNGVAPDQPLPTDWSDSEGLLWRVDVPGRGHSSPVVVGDLVLLATAVKSQQQQSVLAYDRQTGEQRWQTVVHAGGFPPAREIHSKATNANSTVACDGQRVYATFFNSGKITATALDMEGNELWRTDVGPFESKFGYAPSPVLYKSLVLVNVDTRGGCLAALDGQSGDIAWRVPRPSEFTYSSPWVGTLGGQDQLLLSGAQRIVSYDPATGQQRWSTDCVADSTCGTVVTMGDRLFASGGFPQRQTVCLSATGEILWSNKTKMYEPSLLAVNGLLLGVTDDGIAYCWSAEDGEQQWRERLSGSFSASPLCCNGTLYVPDLSGKTYVFQASGENYQQIAVNQLGDDCYASPAAHEGRLYLRIGVGRGSDRQEQLCCIGSD